MGFAVPSNRVKFIVPQLIATGHVTHTGRASLGDILLSKSPGDTVTVTINRGGQQMTVNVTLGELAANS